MSAENNIDSQEDNLIRPMNAAETASFLKEYKDLFLNSIPSTTSDKEKERLIGKINQLTYIHNKIDSRCVVEINKRLVRIEYPGEVKNLSRAIETLGGVENVEASVAEHNKKLELHFHNRNRYNKPAAADKDFKPGILLKVKTTNNANNASKYEYTVEGVSVMNFLFNRLCDFQYLPLVADQPECKASKTDNIYDKIVPRHLPTADWLVKEECKDMDLFLLPVRFSRNDSSQMKLISEHSEKNETKLKLKTATNVTKNTSKQQKNLTRIFGRNKQQTSIFVNYKEYEVPTKPLEASLKLLTARGLDETVEKVKQLFEERPIWTKAAIRYNTGLTHDQSKIVLPIVAYYFVNGPWRISWVKFGYDPRKDSKARIYQTLDYRIRTAESTKLKVKAKRSYTCKTLLNLEPNNLKKVSLKDDVITSRPRLQLDERCYVLRPMTIPPARQMFFQLCDLLLPEIEEMITKLPKQPDGVCDPKNGWLPRNFIETCRDIVNRHVLEAVQKELLEEKKELDKEPPLEKKKGPLNPIDYCSEMLTNIKKGIYKKVELKPLGFVPRNIDLDINEEDIEQIDLSSDEDDYTVGEIIQSTIPETIDEEDEESDNASQVSEDPEIDMEIVHEINEMIQQSNKS